ncbi:MAG: ABC transporter ATP-binding protein [Deltaproteobacteria bacterium]|nr:ABC transporter ATP-binding protein [Deltaproteobacteria bacterium]
MAEHQGQWHSANLPRNLSPSRGDSLGSDKSTDLVDVSLFQRARQAVDRVTSPSHGAIVDTSDRRAGRPASDNLVLTEPAASRTPSDALISVADLVKTYENGAVGIPVIRDVNLQVFQGEIVAVTGPSGCGKSTLLFMLGLFLSPTAGTYHFGGEDVLTLGRSDQAEFRRSRVGFVFQTSDLLENSTVYENLEYPLIYAGVPQGERSHRIEAALKLVNLRHRIRHPANHLSGGERQRVAVARALVNRPQVILADEPTGQLDRDNTRIIMDHFEGIAAEGDTAVILVTHDPQVAARCTRVCILEDGVFYGEGE